MKTIFTWQSNKQKKKNGCRILHQIFRLNLKIPTGLNNISFIRVQKKWWHLFKTRFAWGAIALESDFHRANRLYGSKNFKCLTFKVKHLNTTHNNENI